MRLRRLLRVPVVLTAFLAFACIALAQINAGVDGTVADPSGAVIPGVSVTAKNVATGVTTNATSNAAGAYAFASLQPGTYTISAMAGGFQAQTYENVMLG